MQTSTVSDEELVVQTGAGDRRAVAELVRRFSPKIMGMAQRMLNNRADAEDIVQEVFLRVWRVSTKWETGKAKFSTWLHRVAMNACLDKLRKPKMSDADKAPDPIDQSATPAKSLEERQREGQVQAALSELPERQRAAIELCYYQDVSNIEAANILDVSVDALESLLSRGRRKLKSALFAQKEDLLDQAAQADRQGLGSRR